MTKKGKVTREFIVERAAGLFNSLGYYRASMSDLMQATGLEKGGIYNHFQSKDELAVAAFEYAVRLGGSRLMERVLAVEEPMDKLIAFIDAFNSLVVDPPIPGGCPLLNCAIENDDGNPLLAEKVRQAMEKLYSFVDSLIKNAQAAGQLSKDLNPQQLSTFLISSLEGGIMLSKLYDDKHRMELVVLSLKDYLQACATRNRQN